MQFEDAVKFVYHWQTSATLSEACDKLGIDRRDASNMAAHLRRKEVPLKEMPRKPEAKHHYLWDNDLADLKLLAKRPREEYMLQILTRYRGTQAYIESQDVTPNKTCKRPRDDYFTYGYKIEERGDKFAITYGNGKASERVFISEHPTEQLAEAEQRRLVAMNGNPKPTDGE